MRWFAALAVSAASTAAVAQTSEQKPLTPAQAQRLQALMKNVGEVFSVADGFDKGANPHLVSFVSGDQPSPIFGSIQDGECEKKLSLPEDNPPLVAGDNQVPTFSYDVNGPKCPVHYHVDLHGHQVGTTKDQAFHADFTLVYEAKTDGARKLADVDQTTYIGVIDAGVAQTPDGHPHMDMTATFGGSGHSQKEGAFKNQNTMKVALTVGGPGGPLEFSGSAGEGLDFGFHEINASLVSQMGFGAHDKSFYKLNGKEITAEEYKKYREDFKLPGGLSQDQGAGGGQTPVNVSCKIDLYPASALTPAQATQLINARQPITVPALFSMPVNQTQKMTIPMGDHDIAIDAQVSASVVQIQLSLCAPGATSGCASVSRAYLPDEDRTYADALGDMTSVIGCKP